MMTARKRVGLMPTHFHAVRHSIDYSSLDHFSSDDSSSSSSSSSSSETSSGSSTDALSDSASIRSFSDHSLPASPLGTRSSHRLCSLVPSVHRLSGISERPSHDSSSASLSRKRSRSHVGLGDDFEDESNEPSRSRGTDLEMDVDVKRSDGIKIDPDIQADIDECFAYTDALGDRGIDARVVRVDRVTHLVVAGDIPEPAREGAVEVTYETLGDLVQRFHDHTEEILVHHRIQDLERDNRRLRDIVDVES
ncbi:hypothetical protein Tco_0005472 [Tanacetum coccineum]